MANSLLDFVMSVVRDPDVAARYAADPAQTIADANLTDVTSADVSSLIPVVSESLSMAVPSTGVDTAIIADADSNVWASGAATSAFDAFDDQVPESAFDDVPRVVTDLVGQPDQALQSGLDALADAGVPTVVGGEDPSVQFDATIIDDVPVDEPLSADDWQNAVAEVPHAEDAASGFDIFD
jgi:hypothetical protein